MSLNSSSFFQINTRYEAYRLIHDPTRLFSLLYSKYGDIEEEFDLLHINQIMYNFHTKFNSKYKEIKYSDIIYDYLKRIYKKKESINRIPKLSEYYKNYHLFFCRPTLINKKLGQLMCDYEDNKAELFYKKNYQQSKELSDKISLKEKKKDKNKKNSSLSISFSSLDNITNNKIIFDKETKKMLERTETEENNYYNTLTLESSRSNIITNNNCLVSKRNRDDSFERCIHALVNFHNKRNKNKNEQFKKENTFKNKNFKRRKNIIISDINSNFENSFKFYKQKNIMNKSQRGSHNNSNYNINRKINLIFGKNKKNKNIVSNNITRVNSNYNHKNKLISSKKKNNSLFSLSNNKYITSRTNILSASNNNIITDKNPIKETINKNVQNMKIFNSKRLLTNNKSILNFMMSNKKNKTHIFNNNYINNTVINSNYSNIYSNLNLNISPNLDIIKNLKFGNDSNYKKLTKLTEYLNQTKNKDKQDIKNNFVQKKIIHKKNSMSMGGGENKNLFFNNLNNINNRVVKKKITINKNLKIAISNINNMNISNNIINSQKERHIKKNIFDFNTLNQTDNYLKQNSNVTNINIDEFNTIIDKPKKIIYKINTDYNNLKNKKILNKEDNKSKNNSKKLKNTKFSPSMKKIFNKIPFAQTLSKGKNIHKKNLIVNIMNPNSKITEYEFTKETNSPCHKKNNYSMYKTEDLINNNFIINFPIYKSNIRSKNHVFQSNNNIISNNFIKKNISPHLSPTHHLHYSNILSSKNKNKLTQNSNEKNNIFKKTSINKNIKLINHKKEKTFLINSNTNRKNKKINSKIYLRTNNNTNIGNNFSDNKIISKKVKKEKKKSKSKNNRVSYNNPKENDIINKSNSNLKNNLIKNGNDMAKNTIFNNLNNNALNGYFSQELKNNSINNNENINISIGKNNINIKDSILHINKIYIKNNIINNINNLNNKNYRNIVEKKSKDKEMKNENIRIKTVENICKKNKLNIKSLNSSKNRYDYSPKIINVNRNNNLTTKNNDDNKEIKIRNKK